MRYAYAICNMHATAHYFGAYSIFRGSYFRGGRPIREKCEILHHAKISRYTVYYMNGTPGISVDRGTCVTSLVGPQQRLVAE